LAALLVVAAPFGTAVAAFMTIVWINRPGVDGMVIVYAVLMGLESLALDFLTSPRRAWASPRTFLRVTFILMAGIAPLVLIAYAFVKGMA
jgi:hypothetical protein